MMNKKKGIVLLILIIAILLVSGCSSEPKELFKFKIKPEYSDKLTSEDAAVLLDYLRAASNFQQIAMETIEETPLEEEALEIKTNAALDHFNNVSESEIRFELLIAIGNYNIYSGFVPIDKIRHQIALNAKEIGLTSKYDSMLDPDKVLEGKEEARERLLVFKKYVD